MILPARADSISEYFDKIESITESTFLQNLASFYRDNIVDFRFIYDQVKSEIPNYYIGSDIKMIISGLNIELSDIIDSKRQKKQIKRFYLKYVNFIKKQINKYVTSDEQYIDQLSTVYQRIYSVNKSNIKRNLQQKYNSLIYQTDYSGKFILPQIFEDLITCLSTY